MRSLIRNGDITNLGAGIAGLAAFLGLVARIGGVW